jgi:hypothetical protein
MGLFFYLNNSSNLKIPSLKFINLLYCILEKGKKSQHDSDISIVNSNFSLREDGEMIKKFSLLLACLTLAF